MSEYWKSTPSYWCKFCSTYVKDTPAERRNHENNIRHQNNIQRNLRELHKTRDREEREKQFAKDEVARLNGIVSGKPADREAGQSAARARPAAVLTPAQERRKHAEQLLALGVKLPEGLQKEVQGVSDYHVVSERVVENAGISTVDRSLAEVLAEARREKEAPVKDEEAKSEEEGEVDRKRKFEEEDEGQEAEAPRRRNWGQETRRYPGAQVESGGDLDALLSGVAKKKEPVVKAEDGGVVKKEEEGGEKKVLAAVPDIDGALDPAPTVVFKKRKTKFSN